MITLNMRVRESSVFVNVKTEIIDNLKKKVIDDENFLNQLNKEVIQKPHKAKKLKKLLLATQAAFVSVLVHNNIALANPSVTPDVLPPELVTGAWMIIVVIAVLGLAAGLIGLMLAGIYKMVPIKGNTADTVTQNILKGLGQVLLSPIIVALIIGIVSVLFYNIPMFQPIQQGINVFLQK